MNKSKWVEATNPETIKRLIWTWKGTLCRLCNRQKKVVFSGRKKPLDTGSTLMKDILAWNIPEARIRRSDLGLWHERPGLHYDPIVCVSIKTLSLTRSPGRSRQNQSGIIGILNTCSPPHYKECTIIEFVHPHIIGQQGTADQLGLFTRDLEPIQDPMHRFAYSNPLIAYSRQ